jgi:histidinol-phosphate aminotransferase
MPMKNKPTMIRLNANENFYGCSPAALRNISKNTGKPHEYPAAPMQLEHELAEKNGVEKNRIVSGGGSVRLIDGIIQTLTAPDEEIIIFERSFIAYEQLSAAHRRKYVFAPQTDFTCDIRNVFPLLNPKTKLIFIANPNNPTGTIISGLQLEHLMQQIPQHVLVVLDEAYHEYVSSNLFPDSIQLQKKYPNLVILRTFSKIYGLAGLRIGYAIAEEKIADTLRLSRIPFFLNPIAEQAALQALRDTDFISKCAMANEAERKFLYANLQQAGYQVVNSQANYLYVYFESNEEKEEIFSQLSGDGLLVCNLKVFGQENSLRIGIGDRSTNNRVLESMKVHEG